MSENSRKENIKLLTEDYIDFIKTTIQETGDLYPSFTLFTEIKDKHHEFNEPKLGLIHIPIPSNFMHDADSKDELINELLPEISKTIKNDFIPYALACSTIESAKNVEFIFMNIESDDENNIYIYKILKVGVGVNKDGDLVDKIEVTEANDLIKNAEKQAIAGRFANLFHLFK